MTAMRTTAADRRKFPMYDDCTYEAVGRVYRANGGWGDLQPLYRFRGPYLEKTTQEGLVRLAHIYATRNGLPSYGDESVEFVRVADY